LCSIKSDDYPSIVVTCDIVSNPPLGTEGLPRLLYPTCVFILDEERC